MRLKLLLRNLKYRLEGLPPVINSSITTEIIKKYVKTENPIILEIGCNDGSQSLWFAKMFKNPTIYCFEPDPRAIKRFKDKVGDHMNIHLFDCALSNKNGEIEFFQSSGFLNEDQKDKMPDGWDLSGSIRQPTGHLERHPWVKFESCIKVKTSTLDSWCSKHKVDSIDFIWMDVQGAEIDVFNGGENALNNTKYIYTEYSNQKYYEGQYNLRQLLDYLTGFKPVKRYPNDVLLVNNNLKEFQF